MGKTSKAMKPGTVYTNNCIGSLYNLVSRSSSKEHSDNRCDASHSTTAFYYKFQTKPQMCVSNSKGYILASHDERIHFKQVAVIIWIEQI